MVKGDSGNALVTVDWFLLGHKPTGDKFNVTTWLYWWFFFLPSKNNMNGNIRGITS